MKRYEKDLKALVLLSDGGCKLVHQTASGIPLPSLRFLSARGLIRLEPAGNNEFWIVMEPGGLTYFADQSERRSAFIKEHLAGFLSGFFSGFLAGLCVGLVLYRFEH